MERESPLTDEPIATRAAALGRLSNEALQQTRSALARIAAALAAERRCSTDLFRPVALVNWLVGRDEERPDGERRC